MSKKDKVVELLKQDVSVDEICKQTGASTSYVYRIKREMGESEGDHDETEESGDNDNGDLVVDSTGGSGADVEGDVGEKKEDTKKQSTNKVDGLGGVKKRKKTVKKTVENTEENTEENSRISEVKTWIIKKWKTMLLTLGLLTLLVLMMLLPSKTPKEEPIQRTTRFPGMAR